MGRARGEVRERVRVGVMDGLWLVIRVVLRVELWVCYG